MRFETKDGHIISEQTVICGYSKQIGVYGVAAVANALAAEGAEHIGISVQIQIPDYGYQLRIHGLEKSIRENLQRKRSGTSGSKIRKSPVLVLHRLS
ncbi:MAG: hypothetical protein V8S14_04405 [Lachnospiraceae bacterium]